MAKTKITITIDEDTLERTQELANDENRKFSNMVETILKEHLKAVNFVNKSNNWDHE